MTVDWWWGLSCGSDMGCHIDGFIAVAAHTHVLQEGPVTGRAADVIAAANTAAEVALRLVRPGKKVIVLANTIWTFSNCRTWSRSCMLIFLWFLMIFCHFLSIIFVFYYQHYSISLTTKAAIHCMAFRLCGLIVCNRNHRLILVMLLHNVHLSPSAPKWWTFVLSYGYAPCEAFVIVTLIGNIIST